MLSNNNKSINCSHTMGHFGDLHVIELDAAHLESLRDFCKNTSCDATHIVGETDGMLPLIEPIRNLIQQKNNHEPILLTKLPDGYVAHTPSNVVLSLIKDEHLCQPVQSDLDVQTMNNNNMNNMYNSNNNNNNYSYVHNVNINNNNKNKSSVMSYSLVQRPDQTGLIHFKLVKDHDGVLPPTSITNFCPVDHALAKIAAAIPLTTQPRAIFASPNLGTLHGFHLAGQDAVNVKNVFFNLINKTKTEGMYDATLKLPNDVSLLLGLNDPEGKICIAPMQNGMIGYRNRKTDDGQTLIFLANSNDFHDESPLPADKSVIQVFKMNYTSKEKNAKRIFVHTRKNPPSETKCVYDTPLIHPGMSVQEALNCIEYSMRKSYMEHKNIGDYPQYCEIMKLVRDLNM